MKKSYMSNNNKINKIIAKLLENITEEELLQILEKKSNEYQLKKRYYAEHTIDSLICDSVNDNVYHYMNGIQLSSIISEKVEEIINEQINSQVKEKIDDKFKQIICAKIGQDYVDLISECVEDFMREIKVTTHDRYCELEEIEASNKD